MSKFNILSGFKSMNSHTLLVKHKNKFKIAIITINTAGDSLRLIELKADNAYDALLEGSHKLGNGRLRNKNVNAFIFPRIAIGVMPVFFSSIRMGLIVKYISEYTNQMVIQGVNMTEEEVNDKILNYGSVHNFIHYCLDTKPDYSHLN